jgi:RNA polymerase sigma-70 factor (ECF subfamily)
MLSIYLAAVLADDDPDLISRLRKRDPAALSDIYDRFGKLAYSIVYGIVRHPQTSEDLVQEVFLRLWNRVADFDAQRGSLRVWIVCMARSRALDHARSAQWKRRGREETDSVMESLCFDEHVTYDLTVAEQMRSVRSALSTLSESEQTALRLAYFEGLSQSQIAERLQQPLGTVKTWLRTALQKLRRAMEVKP